MKTPTVKYTIRIISTAIFVLAAFSFSNAQDGGSFSGEIPELQKQARIYRDMGIQQQNLNNIDEAAKFYRKAIEIDPTYAVAYNDLGVILESKGQLDDAEKNYMRATEVDPQYLSAYSNLALLYENKRELDKAAYYWGRRAELGIGDDLWTRRAAQRKADIEAIVGVSKYDPRERQIIDFAGDIAAQKDLERRSDPALAQSLMKKARSSYERGDDAAALKTAIDAMQLDSSNNEIKEFIDKVQIRLLSK